MMRYQRTIKNEIHFKGIGLHSGKPVTVKLKPAPANFGIVFVRTDWNDHQIAAVAQNTGDTSYATSLTRYGISVRTVEHLLSALSGMNIDNVRIEIDEEEVPIMDGSAGPFMRMITEAGIETQKKFRRMLKVIKPIFVREGNKQVAVWPARSLRVSYFIDFNHPLLKEQSLQYLSTEESYLREVAYARTFGFLKDVKSLQANGLAKGASLENAVALGETTVLNKEGLRYQDEFVRHKILDLIGDLSLIGMPIIGHIVAHKSGHALNAQIVRKLLENQQAWVPVNDTEDVKVKQHEMQLQHAAL